MSQVKNIDVDKIDLHAKLKNLYIGYLSAGYLFGQFDHSVLAYFFWLCTNLKGKADYEGPCKRFRVRGRNRHP